MPGQGVPSAPPAGYPTPPPAPGYGYPGYGYPAQADPPPGYGQPAPGYAYPVAYGPGVVAYPAVPVMAPPKSKAVAALLCFFLGGLGIHRFYSGQVGLGLALLLTSLLLGWTVVWLAVTFVWVLIDFILILSGGVRDQYGRPLV